MKLQNYLLRSFNTENDNFICEIAVPVNSIFLNKVYLTHDGIYACFAINELVVEGNSDVHTFQIVLPGTSIPTNAVFIDMLDAIVERSDGSGLQDQVLFPIFKLP